MDNGVDEVARWIAGAALAISLLSAGFTGGNFLVNLLSYRRGMRRVRFVGTVEVSRSPDGPRLKVRVLNLSLADAQLLKVEFRENQAVSTTGGIFPRHSKRPGSVDVDLPMDWPAEREANVEIPVSTLLAAWKSGYFVNVTDVRMRLVTAPNKRHSKTFRTQEWNDLIRRIADADS